MPGTLPIHINRDGLHDIEVAQSFEADDSFTVALENHGAPVHAYVHLDDDLSRGASLAATNHYVEGGTTRYVTVTVHDAPASGKLKVATGYGAETAYVDVDITEPDERGDSVRVDESLSKPKRRPADSDTEPSELTKNLPLLVLGVLALFLVIGVGAVVDGVVAVFGALVVLAGLGAAAYFLTR
ncbi:DUF7524 family protein [Haladaptatus salinisoli]|uniref:DUF7524 family protein n=1 Tax=Haladaptatus salinisoli TaxID=2884876 RepID=UPI001D0A6E5B|nr:hypothetical protein [Haladaptatus salinisoli]